MNLFDELNKNQNLKTFLTNSITIFTIIDIIVTAGIGLFILLIPNLTVMTFRREPTFALLVIIILLMILFSARSFITKRSGFLIFSFLGSLIITPFILYAGFSLIKWYLYNPEGIFNFRFLSIIKKATFETKMELYQNILSQMLDIIREQNAQYARHIEKSPDLLNPPTISIMQTSYHDIPNLVETMLKNETHAYEERARKALNLAASATGTSETSYIKYFIIAGGTIIGALTIIFILNNQSVIYNVIKKGFTNVTQTQVQIENMGKQLTKDAINHVAANANISSLAQSLSVTTTKIDQLDQINEVHQQTIDHLIYILDHVARPCIQALYVGIKAINKDTAKIILRSLKEEQRDFITATSKLII